MTRVLVAGARVRSERSDAETGPLVDALARRGVHAEALPWDLADEVAGWSGADLVVVRTTWDYTERLEPFLGWAADVDAVTRLQNPLEVLRWNAHKAYLVELAAAGVPVVPTTVVPRGTPEPELDAGPLVVKPAVSAGGRGTHRGDAASLAEVATTLLAAGDLLVQPVVESIGRDGEVSLIRIGDRWSHAVRKLPATGEFRVHERHGGRLEDHTPTSEEVAVAERAVACAPAPVHAARVDLVRIAGEPTVMELELIEPELFLRRAPGSPDRLAEVLVAAASA